MTLSGYMKEEISEDLVSKRSEKTFDIQANLNSGTTVQQPSFKKKKNDNISSQEYVASNRITP